MLRKRVGSMSNKEAIYTRKGYLVGELELAAVPMSTGSCGFSIAVVRKEIVIGYVTDCQRGGEPVWCQMLMDCDNSNENRLGALLPFPIALRLVTMQKILEAFEVFETYRYDFVLEVQKDLSWKFVARKLTKEEEKEAVGN